MFVGIYSLRDRIVPLSRLCIVPLIFFILSIKAIQKNYGFDDHALGLWTLGVVIGAFHGWLFVRHNGAKIVDSKKALIRIPGNASTLVILLSFFIVRYARGMAFAIKPELMLVREVMIADIILAGFFIGFLVGRIAFYLRKLYQTSCH